MRTIGGLLIALCLGASARPTEAQSASIRADTLTVADVVALARHRAPAVLAAELDRQAATFESSAVARNRRPDLAFAGRALLAPKGFYDPAITNLGQYEATVVMDWAIADGGVRARARARSALDLAVAKLLAAAQARDVGFQAADLANTLLRHREVEAAQLEAVSWINRLALLMRGAVRAGVRSTTDSVRIALERNAAAAALEKTRFDERTAEIDLMALMGLPGDSTLVLIEPGFPERSPTVEDSIRVMASVQRQPEIGIARIAEERARLDVLEARRTNAPTVDLSLDAGLKGTDLTRTVPEDLLVADPDATFADRLRRDLGASASINLRAPVRGPAARLTTQSKTLVLRAAGLRSNVERANQERIALEILARWRSAHRMLLASRDATQGAEQNLLRVKSLYSGGAIQLLDLLDARRVYQVAIERHADALQESRSAQFRAEDRP